MDRPLPAIRTRPRSEYDDTIRVLEAVSRLRVQMAGFQGTLQDVAVLLHRTADAAARTPRPSPPAPLGPAPRRRALPAPVALHAPAPPIEHGREHRGRLPGTRVPPSGAMRRRRPKGH